MGDHPAKEFRDSNELTDFIFDPPLKDVRIFCGGFFVDLCFQLIISAKLVLY